MEQQCMRCWFGLDSHAIRTPEPGLVPACTSARFNRTVFVACARVAMAAPDAVRLYLLPCAVACG